MRNAVTVSAVFCILTFAPLVQCQDQPSEPLFSPDQLDNLLAQIALYPDPLLAQILVAATYPDQIDEAARFVRGDSNPDDIDGQNWNVSVKAVAHYPTVIAMMADQLDWTTALGQAYANQPDDVMASVQRLRADAQAAGNLQSDAQMQVVDDNGDIDIWPEQPQYIYIPEYDPAVIYSTYRGFSWGPPYPIGAWLNIDFDWHAHRVIYHGWQPTATSTWITRSFPFVRQTPTYVNGKLRNVTIDRNVANRHILYTNLDRYQTVHRGITYNDVRAGSTGRTTPTGISPLMNNKIIERNVNTGDSRINDYRGYAPQQPQQPQRPEPAGEPRQQVNRPQPPPRSAPPAEQRPAPPPAFSGNQGGFNARDASQRGQQSRQEMQHSAPPPRPAPAPRAEPAPRPAPPPPPAREDGGKKR